MNDISTDRALSTYTAASDWKNYIEAQPTFKILGRMGVDLQLQKQNLTDENIVALAEVLKDDQKIWRLNLSENKIGDIGAKALAVALKTNQFICTNGLSDTGNLDLCDNLMSKEGFKAIMSAIKETGRPLWTIGIGPIDLVLDEEKDKAEIAELNAIMDPLVEEQNVFRSQLFS